MRLNMEIYIASWGLNDLTGSIPSMNHLYGFMELNMEHFTETTFHQKMGLKL
jgi:hypothetical protein